MKPPALSIVMPVLNEAQGISPALAALSPLLGRGAELIVVDGGSSDGTVVLASALGPRVSVIAAPQGRAQQMNAGAQHAHGHTLLFLHADTVLPDSADSLIAQALAQDAAVWGRFDVRIQGQSPLLPVVATLMNWRSRWSGIATGDQAMFMTRRAFDQLGGFPVQPLMEDIEMSKRLYALSRPACIGEPVVTSGRRWDSRGALRTIALMWRLRFAYWRGVPAERLAAQYR